MKIELHLHTSRYSACAASSPEALLCRLTEASYEAVFLTEHDAVWSDGELAELQDSFPAVRIYPGLEASIGGDWSVQHLLVLGTNDPRYLAMSEPGEILRRARGEGHLTILAHPCRWEGADRLLRAGLAPDAVEAYTCNQEGDLAEQAIRLAKRLGIPAVNAGDIHHADRIGRFWIETTRPIVRAPEIRPAILDRAYRNCRGD